MVSSRVAAVLIVLAGLFAYTNSFGGVMVFDDEPAIAQNPNLKSLWPLTRAVTAPKDTTLAGRPVASLSFAIDYALSGGTLEGFHATNLLIHLGAALLVFGIARRTLLTPRLHEAFGVHAEKLALTMALVFVVHPLQTGSVTYIVQRVESLMGFLFLLTLYAAIRATESSSARPFWMALSILACALGMGTKEVMVSAPLVVMLWDWLFGVKEAEARRVPLYRGLFAAWAILGVLVASGGRSSSVGFGFSEWPWWRYLLAQAEVIPHYLRLAFYPRPLVLDYDWRAPSSILDVLAPAFLTATVLAVTLWGLVRRATWAFPGVWFFLILAPTSSLLPIVTEVAAEHRMYLPLLGVVSSVVLLAYSGAQRVLPRLAPSLRSPAVAAGLVVSAGLLIALSVMTRERNLDYRSFERIWSDTVEKRPHNARARNNLGSFLMTSERFAEAEAHLRVAVAENVSFPEAEANLGVVLAAQGRPEEGAERLRRALALKPDFVAAHRNLAETYGLQHRLGDALHHYLEALELEPDNVDLLNRAAWILATTPDPAVRSGERAVALAERAVLRTLRRDPASLDSLAAALAEKGDFARALNVGNEALSVALRASQAGMAADIQRRLAVYALGRPFREP